MTKEEGVAGGNFDKGYPKINYNQFTDPKGKIEGASNRSVLCEEIWETALVTLDEWRSDVHWKEEIDPNNTSAKDNKLITRYQKLRSLIEGTLQRPIPWVLNAPTIMKSGKGSKELSKAALKNREKVYTTIAHLKDNILIGLRKKIQEKKDKQDPTWKEDEMKYQKALVAGLFWFALTPPKGGDVSEDTPASLRKYGISSFEEYLRKKGGLGLATIKVEARLEATALETLTSMRGLCTEQSKVLFAVMRMAGIKAHFIEPRLLIDYYYGNKNVAIREVIDDQIPLLGHVASGIAIEIQNGHPEPEILILDPALQMVEPDYQNSPYWILSLRHFLMMDLGNLAGDQLRLKEDKGAQGTLEQAFRLGYDSTAYDAYTNYTTFLGRHRNTHSLVRVCASLEECAKTALDLYPYSPVIYYNYGRQLAKRTDYQGALTQFLKALEYDPRFPKPQTEILSILQRLRLSMATPRNFHQLLDETVKKLEETEKNHAVLEDKLNPLRQLIARLHRFK